MRPSLVGKKLHLDRFSLIIDFGAAGQGIQLHLEGGGRIVYRLSGTGTEGATVRVYLEDRIADPAHLLDDPQEALADMIAAADEAAELHARTGRAGPDVIT